MMKHAESLKRIFDTTLQSLLQLEILNRFFYLYFLFLYFQ